MLGPKQVRQADSEPPKGHWGLPALADCIPFTAHQHPHRPSIRTSQKGTPAVRVLLIAMSIC